MATTVYGKKNEFMSYDTYMERKSPVDIYTVMELKTLKFIIALSSFKYVIIQDGCHIYLRHTIFTQKNQI